MENKMKTLLNVYLHIQNIMYQGNKNMFFILKNIF